MAEGWRFCPASQKLVKKIQKPLTPQEREDRNKWLAEFKEDYKDNDFGMSLYSMLMGSAKNRDKREAAEAEFMVRPVPPVNPAEAFYEAIEAEPMARFSYMMEEGCKNHALFKILAERLSGYSVERICKYMFETSYLNLLEIDTFFCQFFPIYLKRAYSWMSLDIMVKASRAYPLPFRSLLHILLRDLDAPSTMLNDFVLNLEDAEKYVFLATVMELELANDEFIHNLAAITSAYKTSQKCDRLQNYIYNSLINHGTLCMADWNYGKLLLSYLQSISHGQSTFDIRMLERLIDMHRSPFKRPCMSVLGEAIRALNEAAIPPEPS